MAKTELPFEYHIFQMPSKSLQFNMSDSLRKEFDTFTITDEQIKAFFGYVVSNDYCKPNYTEVVKADINNKFDLGRNIDILKKYVEEHNIEKLPSYKDAIKKLEKIKYDKSVKLRPKSYTSGMKIIAGGDKFYNFELESCRQLLRFGCYYGKETEFELNEKKYPLAYIGISEDGTETTPMLIEGNIICQNSAVSEVKAWLTGKKVFEYLFKNGKSAIVQALELIEKCKQQESIVVNGCSIDSLQDDAEKLRKRLKNYQNMLADELISVNEYKENKTEIETRLAEIDQMIHRNEMEIAKRDKKVFDLEKIKDWSCVKI